MQNKSLQTQIVPLKWNTSLKLIAFVSIVFRIMFFFNYVNPISFSFKLAF